MNGYNTLAAGWLVLLAAILYVDNPRHRRVRRLLSALIMPAYGLLLRMRVIR